MHIDLGIRIPVVKSLDNIESVENCNDSWQPFRLSSCKQQMYHVVLSFFCDQIYALVIYNWELINWSRIKL